MVANSIIIIGWLLIAVIGVRFELFRHWRKKQQIAAEMISNPLIGKRFSVMQCIRCNHKFEISESEKAALEEGHNQFFTCPNCGK